jgi:hypothetical protein
MVNETIEKESLEPVAEKIAHCATDSENPRALRAFDPHVNRAIEHAFIPRGSVIRVIQRVRDITDGSERDLHSATLSPLPSGGFEFTTLVGEDEVFIDVTIPAHPERKSASRSKRGGRS